MLIKKTALAAALIATALTACAGTPTKESTGEYIDDATITTKVKSAFVNDSNVDAVDIKVVTFKGKVQLSGFVDSAEQVNRAVKIASSVDGVKSVSSDVHVKSSR